MSVRNSSDRDPFEFVVNTTDPVREVETRAGLVKIAPYEDGDEHAILQCFQTVFGVERSIEAWRWEFLERPVRFRSYLGKLEDGSVVSQFCGLPVTTKVGDRDYHFTQNVDSMVHPSCREGLKKRGVFARTLLAYAYDLGGAEGDLVQFGLPNPISYRLGRQTLYYVPLMRTYTHTKAIEPDTALEALPERVSGLRREFHPRAFERFGDEHDALWEKVKARHDVICHRDSAYMNWRYVANPNWNYELVELRTPEGSLCGVAVLRRDWLIAGEMIIADWLVDTEAGGASEALVAACEHAARHAGAIKLRCYLNLMAPESRVFEDARYGLEDTCEHFRLVAHSYDPSIVTEDHLNRHWYYTAGDFDVV